MLDYDELTVQKHFVCCIGNNCKAASLALKTNLKAEELSGHMFTLLLVLVYGVLQGLQLAVLHDSGTFNTKQNVHGLGKVFRFLKASAISIET